MCFNSPYVCVQQSSNNKRQSKKTKFLFSFSITVNIKRSFDYRFHLHANSLTPTIYQDVHSASHKEHRILWCIPVNRQNRQTCHLDLIYSWHTSCHKCGYKHTTSSVKNFASYIYVSANVETQNQNHITYRLLYTMYVKNG